MIVPRSRVRLCSQAAICWALFAIRAELLSPDLIKGASAYAEVGEAGRVALQLCTAGSAIFLAVGSLAISSMAFVQRSGWTFPSPGLL